MHLVAHAALVMCHCIVLPQSDVAGVLGLGKQYEEHRKEESVGHRAQEVAVCIVVFLSLPCHVLQYCRTVCCADHFVC